MTGRALVGNCFLAAGPGHRAAVDGPIHRHWPVAPACSARPMVHTRHSVGVGLHRSRHLAGQPGARQPAATSARPAESAPGGVFPL